MSNQDMALVPTTPSTDLAMTRQITPTAWQMIEALAPVLHQSRLLRGCGNQDQAKMLLLCAYELGFNFSAAHNFFSLIEGRPVLDWKGVVALINRERVLSEFTIDSKPDACTVVMVRRDSNRRVEVTYTLDMARQAGLVKPGGYWSKDPQGACRKQAIKVAANLACPEVLVGLYTLEEFAVESAPLVNEATGEVIDVMPEVIDG
jgi:hypothetical protein